MGQNKKSYCKIVTIDEFNNILEFLDANDVPVEIENLIGTVSFKYEGIEYQTSLTGDLRDVINVGNIWNQFLKLCPLESLKLAFKEEFGYKELIDNEGRKHIHWKIKDPGNYDFVREQYSRKWLKCYSYDQNSAYSYAMLQPMPDTSKRPKLNDFVGPNEIGFFEDGMATTEEGVYAEYIYPLMPSPFTPYVLKYFNKKINSKTIEEKSKWKYFLNIPTGMLHRVNIFMRLAVLYYARNYIRSFIDENTIYCNVDSIVSTKERLDLPLNDNLGSFKAEHKNEDFKFIKSGIYQWGNECHYKGIPGCTISDIEDIKGWRSNFPYKLENRRIIKNEKN